LSRISRHRSDMNIYSRAPAAVAGWIAAEALEHGMDMEGVTIRSSRFGRKQAPVRVRRSETLLCIRSDTYCCKIIIMIYHYLYE